MTYLTETHEHDFLASIAEVGDEVQDVAVKLALNEAEKVLQDEAVCFCLDLAEGSRDAFTHEAKLALRRALAGFLAQ